jgi:hypothetical protein
MPKVGKKHFPYTEAGYREAKAYAEKTGKKVVVEKSGSAKKQTRKQR